MVRRLGAASVGLVLASCGPPAVEAPAPAQAVDATRRSIDSGALIGTIGAHGSHVWKGIPFAKPPTGQFRWRAPRAAESWKGPREALSFGPPCPQLASPLGGVSDQPPGTPVGDEDCLYLNVWAPPFSAVPSPARDPLPVMVWIHGGGNRVGHGGGYDGGRLATTHDLIVVTLNYRLGTLGWFRHSALRAGATSREDASGNYGTLDLIHALRWVSRNAAAFGGDPDRVTIFGESAGARNVLSLLVAPSARGLFHRAIVQSGGTHSVGLVDAETHTESIVAEELARDALASPPEGPRMAAYLRALPAHRLIAHRPADVVRDAGVLPVEPFEDLLDRGQYAQVPVVLGTNRDEVKLFLFSDPNWVDRWFGVIPRIRDRRSWELQAEYQSALWKVEGVDRPARAMRAAQGPSVFAYRFDWDEEPDLFLADLSELLGAAHGLEIPFVFGHFDLGPAAARLFDEANAPGRAELAEAMMSYWAEFAYFGAPGRGRAEELPLWSPWDESAPEAPRFVVLDTSADGGIRMSSESLTEAAVLDRLERDPRLADSRERCAFVARLVEPRGRLAETHYGERCAEYPRDELLAAD